MPMLHVSLLSSLEVLSRRSAVTPTVEAMGLWSLLPTEELIVEAMALQCLLPNVLLRTVAMGLRYLQQSGLPTTVESQSLPSIALLTVVAIALQMQHPME